MMKRFSRRRRGNNDGRPRSIDASEWMPRILEQGIVDAASLEAWNEAGVPDRIAAIGRGERADGTPILVSFSPHSATEALLGGLAAAASAGGDGAFAGALVVVAPQWPAAARRLLGWLGRTSHGVEAVAAPILANGAIPIDAEPRPGVLGTSADQLAARLPGAESRAAFARTATALEGLAAKHGGCVRIGVDRLELVVLARRIAELRIEGDRALLETQIGGRSTTPVSSADLAAALDGLEGQLRRRLNDRKVREGEEGLRGRVVSQLATGAELRDLRPWPMPGADLDTIDGVGINAEGEVVVVAVREEFDWTALGRVLENLGPLAPLHPILFARTSPPLRLGSQRLLLIAQRFVEGLERAMSAFTVGYEMRTVSETSGPALDLVEKGSGEAAEARSEERPARRSRRRGGRGRSGASREASDAEPQPDPETEESPRRGPASERAPLGGPRADREGGGDVEADEDAGRGRGRRRRRPRRARGGSAEASGADDSTDGATGEAGPPDTLRASERSGRSRPRFEEVSLMDLDEGVGAADAGESEVEKNEAGRSRGRSSRRGRRGARGESRRGRGSATRESGEGEASSDSSADAAPVVEEEDLVDADDLSEILARLTEDEPDIPGAESAEPSYDDEEEFDEEDLKSGARSRAGARGSSPRGEADDAGRPAPRKRSAILVHADRDSLLAAVLLARDIRQLDGIWVYPQAELMTFFRSVATDLRDETPIFVVGFSPSPARDVIQAASLYRGRLTWFDRHPWPPEDRLALCEAIGRDAVYGGEGLDSTLPLVLETCTRRSRFSDKLVDLATGRFSQHDFERWGRLWRHRIELIATKTGDIRAEIAGLLAGRPSDLAKEAALIDLPPPPVEVDWVARNEFRLVHFGGHVMVVLDVEPELDLHLCARIARERYAATLSLAHSRNEESFVLSGEETSGKHTLDFVAVADHLADKLEWVERQPDADHVARFRVRELERHPERLEEVITEIAMGRSLLER